MYIISHRGFWKREIEKNTLQAFERSFKSGFGTETDIRDYKGELVISHDIPNESAIPVKEFLKLYRLIDPTLPLALNIKSDGLQIKLRQQLDHYKIKNYFVFDMSVPDGLIYLNTGFNTFTRQSEYEQNPSFYEKAKGIWMDEFKSDWITTKIIETHLSLNKEIGIVSSELHDRDSKLQWNELKKINSILSNNRIILCTDKPEKAKNFFYE
jgi:glycerophosphoryl diester phosphodiesterase